MTNMPEFANPFLYAEERKRKIKERKRREEERKQRRQALVAIELFEKAKKEERKKKLIKELNLLKKEQEEYKAKIEALVKASAGIGHGEEHAISYEAMLYAEECRTKPCVESDLTGLTTDPTALFEQYRGDFGGLHTHCSLHFEEDPYTVTPRKEWK